MSTPLDRQENYSKFLFHAVANNDWHAIIQVYGTVASRNLSFIAKNKRAFVRRQQYLASSSTGRKIGTSTSGTSSANSSKGDKNEDISLNDIIEKIPQKEVVITDVIQKLQEKILNNGNIETIVSSSSSDDNNDTSSNQNGRILTNPLPSFRSTNSTIPYMPMLSEINAHVPVRQRIKHSKSDLSTNVSFDSSVTVNQDQMEQYLIETSSFISNQRPDLSFTVHRKPSEALNSSPSIDNTDDEHNILPIFDGGIANLTPPNNKSSHGPGSGNGTVLHLACLIDSPFSLAILLVMGADASSRHTAFRRSIIHEAAAADSDQCLSLLLELGKELRDEQEEISLQEKCDQNVDANGGRTSLSNILNSSNSFLFRSWNTKKRLNNYINIDDVAINHVDNDRIMKKTARSDSVEDYECRHLDFVSTLELMDELAHKIMSAQISEMDGAKTLLSQCPLSKNNKAFLCDAYIVKDPENANLIESSHKYPVDSAYQQCYVDSHGNTPIHWASFKNSTKALSVLLKHPFNINAVAKPSGWTPLHDAAYSDSAESISLLIAAGGNIHIRANSGATPLCFAAQEDSPKAAALLLEAGADATIRCCDNESIRIHHQIYVSSSQRHSSRFSGYTPLHFCAHYNAHHAARVLLEYNNKFNTSQSLNNLLEIPDLNERLPIHVAVARGSSDVLRELLHGGARVDTSAPKTNSYLASQANFLVGNTDRNGNRSPRGRQRSESVDTEGSSLTSVVPYSRHDYFGAPSSPKPTNVVTPVSSPVLRAMLPPGPITSSKPWNCLSQRSIDECKMLLREAEMNWSPERHSLFHPRDRLAVVELLRVGKRIEQMGTGVFIELWPLVLSYCGRGWFEPDSAISTFDEEQEGIDELSKFQLER